MKKLLSLLLVCFISAGCLLSFATVPAYAANATCSLETFKYENPTFTPQTVFSNNQRIYVAVKLTSVNSLGGIMFDVSYDNTRLNYYAAGSSCVISDSKGASILNDRGSYVRALWETKSTNTNISNNAAIFYIVFEIKEGFTASASCTFGLTVRELFDSDQNDITVTAATGTGTITLNPITVPSSLITLTGKLATIVYNPKGLSGQGTDSFSDIEEAEKQYLALTPDQQNAFAKGYPTLYKNLTDARNTYYRLGDADNVALIQREVDSFLAGNSRILNLSPAQLTTSSADKLDLLSAEEAYKLLSGQANALLDDKYKLALAALRTRMNEMTDAENKLQEAIDEANDFTSEFGYLMDQNILSYVTNTYDSSIAQDVARALTVYNILPDGSKPLVSDLHERLSELKAVIAISLGNDEKEKAIQNAIAEYFQMWRLLVSLNDRKVDPAHEEWIIDAIQYWEKMADLGIAEADMTAAEKEQKSILAEAKNRLTSQIDRFKSLLDVIKVKKAGEETIDNGNSSNNTNNNNISENNNTPAPTPTPTPMPMPNPGGSGDGNSDSDGGGFWDTSPPDPVIVTNEVQVPVNHFFTNEIGFGTSVYIILVMLALSAGVLIAACWLWMSSNSQTNSRM